MFAFNHSGPVSGNASVVIDRSPEAVFRFIGEQFFTNYPRWSPEVRELRQISPGPVRVGTRARQVRVDLGHRSESIFAVTIFTPDRRVCFEGISCPYHCDYEIMAFSSKSSTEVRFTFELSKLDLYLRPFEPVLRDAISNGVKRTVHNLKRLVEAERTKFATSESLRQVPGTVPEKCRTNPGITFP